MRPLIALIGAAALTACATTQPVNPAAALAEARVTYTAVCGEVLRLRNAGRPLPQAIDACIKADDALDTTELAVKAGNLASVTSGTQRALLLIGAAQAVLIAANGSVK